MFAAARSGSKNFGAGALYGKGCPRSAFYFAVFGGEIHKNFIQTKNENA